MIKNIFKSKKGLYCHIWTAILHFCHTKNKIRALNNSNRKFSTSDKCDNCNGSGSKPGYDAGSCSMCGGHGQVRSSQGFFTVQQTCPQCSGSGEEITNPCNSCNGQGKKQIQKRKRNIKYYEALQDG